MFASLVFHKSFWDIKRENPWEKTIGTEYPGWGVPIVYDGSVTTVESLGNYTYGFIGYSYGVSLSNLFLGSYVAAGLPSKGKASDNEIGDWVDVLKGYSSAEKYFGCM